MIVLIWGSKIAESNNIKLTRYLEQYQHWRDRRDKWQMSPLARSNTAAYHGNKIRGIIFTFPVCTATALRLRHSGRTCILCSSEMSPLAVRYNTSEMQVQTNILVLTEKRRSHLFLLTVFESTYGQTTLVHYNVAKECQPMRLVGAGTGSNHSIEKTSSFH